MRRIAFAKMASDTTPKGFHLPKDFHDPVKTMELMENQFSKRYFLSDSGRIFTCEENQIEFNEIFLKDSTIEFQKKKLPFDANRFEYLLFSNDLQLCIGFRIGREGIFARKSILITAFKSRNNLFDTDEEDVISYYAIKFPGDRANHILHCDVSPNLSYLLVIYVQDKTVVCDFLHIVVCDGEERISLKCHGQVDLSATFSFFRKKTKNGSLFVAHLKDIVNPEEQYWYTQFNISETHCLIKAFDKLAVYSLKQGLFFTVGPKNDPHDFIASLPSIVEDTLHGRTLLFHCRRYSEDLELPPFIEMFKLEEMEMFRFKRLNFEALGVELSITSCIVRKLPQIRLFVSTHECIYVIDPFKDAVLQSFDLNGNFTSVVINSNSIGQELFAWCCFANRTFLLKMIDIEHSSSISLKVLAKRSVLSFFSRSQLKMMNIPKNLKIEFGVL